MVEAILTMKRLFELINQNIREYVRPHVEYECPYESNHPLITISREFGSGGSVVARKVATSLGKNWRVYHKDIVDEIAKEARLERQLIRQVDEKYVPLIEEIVGEFFGKRYMTLQAYNRHLVRILSTVGARGNAVIIGRGAQFLFPNALKIRVIADNEFRKKNLRKFLRVSNKKAQELIDRKDRERSLFSRNLFRADQREDRLYDLVIKTSDQLGMDEAAKLILQLARRRFKQ